ncbi:hypothetical protein NCCP1664_14530 [Zafaria cholistanensis]|uniref:Uncharacterized protein n=1 Tax=Zafaria cholistanensis TaxID=1682741 RepID=A0A5A7NSS7_9MICC|nr:hypothetical protein NCCP1664_14530 [Zafaria cholistanensis]
MPGSGPVNAGPIKARRIPASSVTAGTSAGGSANPSGLPAVGRTGGGRAQALYGDGTRLPFGRLDPPAEGGGG